MANLKVTIKRSLIGRPEKQRRTVKALGLRKINSFSVLPDDPCVRGQIFKVKHLVAVEEVNEELTSKKKKKALELKKAEEQQEVKAE